MINSIKKFFQNEEGATAIEYGLIAALIAVACIAALTAVGGQLSETFSGIGGSLSDARTTEDPA
jgi:pilus assembly protein Flp/PilA